MTRVNVLHAAAYAKPETGFSSSRVELSPGSKFALERLTRLITVHPKEHPDWFCRQASAASRHLPVAISEILQIFADKGSERGFLVLAGLTLGGVPKTPSDNTLGIGGSTQLALQMAVVAHVLGEMVAYEAEGCGHLIQDMVPNPRLATTQQSQGSRVELEAHTEQAFSPLRPDYVLLGCLRGDAAAFTYVLDARTLCQLLSKEEKAMLRERRWTTTVDPSFVPYVPLPDEVRGPFPILGGTEDDPTILVDQDLMSGVDESSQALLEKVVDLYVENRHAHCLEPGSILLLDNARAMHGRSSFEPRFDGTDRFIVRGFAVRDRRARLGQMAADRRTILARHS